MGERIIDRDAVAGDQRQPAFICLTQPFEDRRAAHLADESVGIAAPRDGAARPIGYGNQPIRWQVEAGHHRGEHRCDVEAEHIGQPAIAQDRHVDGDERLAGDRAAGEIRDVRLAGGDDSANCLRDRSRRAMFDRARPGYPPTPGQQGR